jgi:hypothetical protein
MREGNKGMKGLKKWQKGGKEGEYETNNSLFNFNRPFFTTSMCMQKVSVKINE